MAVKLTH